MLRFKTVTNVCRVARQKQMWPSYKMSWKRKRLSSEALNDSNVNTIKSSHAEVMAV